MSRKPKNIHYIYKTTCLVTNRYYIGAHSTANLEDGYLGSGKRLRRSIRKYGEENHNKEILEFLPDRESLMKREKEIVTFELIKEDLCMNLMPGGQGGFVSGDAVKMGRKKTDEILFKKYGPKFNQIISKQFHESLTPDEKKELINKIKDGLKRVKFNHATFSNKQHSEKTKQLISQSHKGCGIGENNSQYGTCWITKDGINKKIKKNEINKWAVDGWCKGRII